MIAGTPDAAGTHRHDDTAGYTHTNIASGVLRGSWGVEPIYGSASFQSLPSGYIVKRGDPGMSADASVTAPYVTREYQVCLKCHSDYGFSDNNLYPVGNRPTLGYPGGTPASTNNLQQYTNVAKELQAPAAHKGAGDHRRLRRCRGVRDQQPPLVASGDRQHRAQRALRGNGTDISARFRRGRNAVGTQTMYCSDCHGTNVTSATSGMPNGGENGNPWGRTARTTTSSSRAPGAPPPAPASRRPAPASSATTMRATPPGGKPHRLLQRRSRRPPHLPRRQDRAHALHLVPRRRAARLEEQGLPRQPERRRPRGRAAAGTQVRNNTTAGYTNGPYYLNAMLKIRTFRPSGQWTETSCGSAGAPGNGQSGRDWMRDSSENCQNPP